MTTTRDTEREDTHDITDDTNGPLDGPVVLEAGSMVSGPTVDRFMADFGATVTKIEHSAFGDHIRRFGLQKDGVGLWHKHPSRDKQSIIPSISTDEGVAVFEDLVGKTDLLVENFRPGILERWNVGWERLSEVNDGFVMLRLSGFGQTGPCSERPGFETLVEAMSGFAYLSGFPDLPPLSPSTGLVDNIAALFSTFAVMFALHYRDVHGGGGQYIDTGLIEPISGLFGPQPLHYDRLGAIELRSGNRPTSSAPRNAYRIGDDRRVAIPASAQPFTERTFDAIGRPDLKDNPRFETNEGRLEHADKLDAIIQDWTGDHSREEVFGVFEAADVTLAPVYNVKDTLNDEHYAACKVFLTVDNPDLGEVVVQNVFPKSSETPGRVGHLGPSFGEYDDAVYRDRLGYDKSVLSDLEAKGVM